MPYYVKALPASPASPRRRIAVPMEGGRFSPHFGAATAFMVAEADPVTGHVFQCAVSPAPAHRPGTLPRWLEVMGVDEVVVGGMGERALVMLAEAGITARYCGEDLDPETMVARCLSGALPLLNRENSRCGEGHPHPHDCDHGE